MKRHKHGLSHYKLFTSNMGFLVPVACYEVLPGDTFQQQTSLLVRCSPMIAPVMHPVTVRIHHWFVPNRILWDGWEKFITGGRDGLGEGVGTPPVLTTATPIKKGSLADYFGIPPGFTGSVSSLPFEAYKRIWFQWYADQDFSREEDIPPLDLDWGLAPIFWEKDYFTTARPWTQKGPDVVVPLAGSAPLMATGDKEPVFSGGGSSADNPAATKLQINSDANTNWDVPSVGSTFNAKWVDPKLVADLSAATGANINDFRRAFALQRYQEARARYGSRYTEYLAYLGVRSSDARLQRPEYLGGGKQTISFSEVLQTGPGTTAGSPTGAATGVGTMAGHGISAMRSARFRRFFEEHGIVISLMSVRPKAIYTQGVNRMWMRSTKEDYWQRELEQIGQQEIYGQEVHYQHTPGSTWGYQDRYAEYKYQPSTVHGDFRDTLNFWHMSREFSAAPALNGSFVVCQPTKRIFQEQNTHPLWVMAYNNIQARRMVRKSGSARIL